MSRQKILASLALFALATAARADVHPNIQGGFPVDQVFQAGEIDNVNLFNGALTLTIPLGPTYPVGGGLQYGMKLVYNSNPWRYDTVILNGDSYSQAIPSECSNAGLGWRVSLGRLDPPCQMPDVNGVQNLVYQDETGTDHIWYETLHAGDPEDAPVAGVQQVLYTRDGSYLRMKVLTNGNREVESPDGTTRTFRADGLPTQIRDRFGNHLDVDYSNASYWQLTDNHNRVQRVWFRTDLAPYAQTVDKIELEASGTPNKATYQFHYVHRPVGLACPNNEPGTQQALVPLLLSVTLPDGSSYQMAETDYITAAAASTAQCTDHGGNLLKLTLPTLGKLAWTWRTYVFPTASSAKRHLQTSSGVATRAMLDAGNATLGTWTYTTSLQSLGRELKSSVTDPLGYRTDRFFSVATDSAFTGWSKYDYSLPFTRNTTVNAGGVDLYLSSQVWDGATLLRSEYVLYERDQVNGTYGPPDMYNTNRRPIRGRTVFHDDLVGGVPRHADVISSDFDGLGHYRTTQTDGNFGAGNVRTTTVAFNPARGTYVVNPGTNTGSGYSVFPPNQAWIIGTYTSQQVTEGGETATALFCFDTSTGFLNRKRMLKNSGAAEHANDLLEVYAHTGGNVTSEQFFGGDKQSLAVGNTCAMGLPALVPYQLSHTYQGGVRATSQYAGMNFKSLDLTVEARTGLPSASRDTAETATDFEYDALGRLTWSKPAAGNNDGWTEYDYTRATSPSSLAKVTLRKRGNGSKSAPVLAQSEIHFDAFGRVWKERQLLPGGIWSTRETLYDAAGHKASVSEAQANPTKRTQFLDYDAFGRPRTIRPADGAAHDVTFVYKGTRVVERTTKVGTTQSGGTVTESSSTTTERYDRQGRLWQVEEPSGAGGALVTTTYGHDAGNRLKSVSTPAGVTQSRAFNYDQRGFLLSETHPEKVGAVTYSDYDARGHAGRKVDGPNDLVFTYDKAERLTLVERFGGQDLKKFSYADANGGATDRRLGKLREAIRYNDVPGVATVQVTETYVYGARQGRVSQRDTAVILNPQPGSPVGESFTQTFAYTPLGQPGSVSYPLCTHAGCQAAPPVFADVSAAHPDRPEIEAIRKRGVTDGCATSPLRYCPDSLVSRSQMAVFLIRASSPPGYDPPACVGTFSDVPCTHLHAKWVEELARRGVTAGCDVNPARFCPDQFVTNTQMAIFLLRSEEGGSYTPPPAPTCPSSPPFSDVPCSDPWVSWIAEAKKRGITSGCGGGSFCPGSFVTRAQMAGLLTRTFDIPVVIDPAAARNVQLTYTNGLLTEVGGYGGISYHPNLLVSQVTHENGVVETWANDPNAMRRPGSISATGPAAAWSSGTYVYDGTGNITKIGPAWLTYDKVNRLTAGNVYTDPLGAGAGTQQGYTYDPFGNLTAITGAQARNTPTSASTNRLTGGTYDDAGNLTHWNGALYQYDAFNQMVRMTSGAQAWAYVYTAGDERIWSYDLAEQEASRWALRDLSGQVLREYLNDDGAWSVGTDYIRRDGQLLAAETRLGRRHFHLDHLGTPRLITNKVGYKTAYHVYYPFGEEATAFNQDGERMKFTGHERDLASPLGAGDDLDYMHARHYSPVTGRFLSVDRQDVLAMQQGDSDERTRFRRHLSQPQSWNLYLYSKNNPLKYIDPDGEAAELVVAGELLFAGEGAAAGGGLALSSGAAPILVAGAAGIGLGWGVNQIPGASEALTIQGFSNWIANTFFASKADNARNFVNAKVTTVLEHISRYSPPNPNDPNDRSNKKNIYNKMKGQLKDAKDHLRRLKGKTAEAYEELIRRTEAQLESWWSGGGV